VIDLKNYPITTSLMSLDPKQIRIVPVSAGVIKHYQPQMSKAIWRPAFGRKLGFLVVHGESLLGLLFLATPVIRLTARDAYLFPGADKNFNYGFATKSFMDMSVCVAAQPLAWHWNLGKLMAMLAPTLGDYVETRYPENTFKGVTTTSYYGQGKNGTQYTRVYKFLGYSEGSGHENVDDPMYNKMLEFLRQHCPNCTPRCKSPLKLTPTRTQKCGKCSLCTIGGTSDIQCDNAPMDEWCTVPGCRWRKGLGDGANPRMRRIAAFFKALDYLKIANAKDAIGVDITKEKSRHHGHKRAVWYHPAIPSEQRAAVIEAWYKRWGLPRYEKTKNMTPPYQNGKDGVGYERSE